MKKVYSCPTTDIVEVFLSPLMTVSPYWEDDDSSKIIDDEDEGGEGDFF